MALSRKWKWTGLLLAGLLSTTACYGPFNLTQRYWHWNGNVTGNKWANEGIFLLSVIIPVYGVCTFVDAIIFNSVEFWTGKNWIDAPSGGSTATGRIDAKSISISADTHAPRSVLERSTPILNWSAKWSARSWRICADTPPSDGGLSSTGCASFCMAGMRE